MERTARWLYTLVLVLACLVACAQAPGDPSGPNGPEGPKGPDGPKGPNGPNGPAADPEPLHDTIAYVTADGDTIRLIAPDGTGDRELWAHGRDDPEQVYVAWGLEWNPEATRLAFASTHENWCSLFNVDVFVVGADGTGYGRVTQAPACAELASYPQATVNVPVRNASFDTFFGFLYFQGADEIQAVSLPPNGTGLVTFPNVADLASGTGEEAWQVAAVIVGREREVLLGTVADVPPSGSVTTAKTLVYHPSVSWEARTPTWRADGEAISFVYNSGSLFELPFAPPPLAFGAQVVADDAEVPDFVDHLQRGPTAETADELLFYGSETFGGQGIYLMEEGASAAGEPLVVVEQFQTVKGLAWLPDASGFVYSVTEGDMFGDDHSANMYLYDLEEGSVTPLTSYVGRFMGDLSVSGDGTQVAFELGADLDLLTGELVDPDVYVLDVASGEARLLVAGAFSPAWSR